MADDEKKTGVQRIRSQWASEPLPLGPQQDASALLESSALGPSFSNSKVERAMMGQAKLDIEQPEEAAKRGTSGLGTGYSEEEVGLALGKAIPIPATLGKLGPGFSEEQIDDVELDLDLGKLVLGLQNPPSLEIPESLRSPMSTLFDPNRMERKMISAWQVVRKCVSIRIRPHRLEMCIGHLQKNTVLLAFERGGGKGNWIRHSYGWSCVEDLVLAPRLMSWRARIITRMKESDKLMNKIKEHFVHRKRAKKRKTTLGGMSGNALLQLALMKKPESYGNELAREGLRRRGLLSKKNKSRRKIEFDEVDKSDVNPHMIKEVRHMLRNEVQGMANRDIEALVDRAIVSLDLPRPHFTKVIQELNRRKEKDTLKKKKLEECLENLKKQPYIYLRKVEVEETPLLRMRHVLGHLTGLKDRFLSFTHLKSNNLVAKTEQELQEEEEDQRECVKALSNPIDANDGIGHGGSRWTKLSTHLDMHDRRKTDSVRLVRILNQKCPNQMKKLATEWGTARKFAKFASKVARCCGEPEARANRMSCIPLTPSVEEKLSAVMMNEAEFFSIIIFNAFDWLFSMSRINVNHVPDLPLQLNRDQKVLETLWKSPVRELDRAKEEEVMKKCEVCLLSIRMVELISAVFPENDSNGGPTLKFYFCGRLLAAVKPFRLLDEEDEKKRKMTSEPENKIKLPGPMPDLDDKLALEDWFRRNQEIDPGPMPTNPNDLSGWLLKLRYEFIPPRLREYKYLLRLLIPNMRGVALEEKKKKLKRGKSRIIPSGADDIQVTDGFKTLKDKEKIEGKMDEAEYGDQFIFIRAEAEDGSLYGVGSIQLKKFHSSPILCTGNCLLSLSGEGTHRIVLWFDNSGIDEINLQRAYRKQFRDQQRARYPDNPDLHAGTVADVLGINKSVVSKGSQAGVMAAKVNVIFPPDKEKNMMEMITDMKEAVVFYRGNRARGNKKKCDHLIRFDRRMKFKIKKNTLRILSKLTGEEVQVIFGGDKKSALREAAKWKEVMDAACKAMGRPRKARKSFIGSYA
ncbi:hypothetical protein AAMO2058_000455100 [Amorphochlora amoebiformis]